MCVPNKILKMMRVEQHIIKQAHQWFLYCEGITNVSRRLFNAAQFNQRRSYFYGDGFLTHAKLDKLFQGSPEYKALPAKVAQLVLQQCADTWVNYHKALSAYTEEPCKFTGKPGHPGFIKGRNIVMFNTQAISKREFKQGIIAPSMSPIIIPVRPGLSLDSLCEVRTVPKVGCYVIEVVCKESDNTQLFCSLYPRLGAAIDIGVDNLATVVFSEPTIRPLAINGKPLKSANWFYKKQVARYRGFLKSGTSHRIQNIARNRNNFGTSYIHQCTRLLVKEFLSLGVTGVAIGKNDMCQTDINLGKATNQKFVRIPQARFIDILTYKLEAVGIEVVVGEESYTSKASFLDWDTIPSYTPDTKEKPNFSGRRVWRSWYVRKEGYKIHADVNGAFNMGRKVIPKAFDYLKSLCQRDMGCLGVHPRRITPT